MALIAEVTSSASVLTFIKKQDFTYGYASEAFKKVLDLESANQMLGVDDFDLPWKSDEASFLRHKDRECFKSERVLSYAQTISGFYMSGWKEKVYSPELGQLVIYGTFRFVDRKTANEHSIYAKAFYKFGQLFENPSSEYLVHLPIGVIGLSKREAQCLMLTIIGKTAKQIATELFISVRTVESHHSNLKDKLGVMSQAELIKIALLGGFLNNFSSDDSHA